MTIFYTTPPRSRKARSAESEKAVCKELPYITETHNEAAARSLATRFYVTLKSSRSILLIGPKHTGKLALVKSVAQTLIHDPIQQYQMMVGHAYWASGSRNISVLVEAQTSLNAQNLLMLLERAAKPENANRPFIACLTRISPSEVFNIFSQPGLRLFQGEKPVPFPPNFRLLGTLDVPKFQWWIPALLSNTSVVNWPKTKSGSFLRNHFRHIFSTRVDEKFLATCVHGEQAAYATLVRLLGKQQPFPPLTQAISLLHDHGVLLPREAIKRAVLFLANAWTQEGEGIFSTSSQQTNLRIALSLALIQYIIPWTWVATHPSSLLFRRLNQLLKDYGLDHEISPLMNEIFCPTTLSCRAFTKIKK